MSNPQTERRRSSHSINGPPRVQKSAVLKSAWATIGKLKFLYDIQGKEFWYLEMAKITTEDTESINDEFMRSLRDNFYELGIELGSLVSGQQLTVELYKFNETLSRLFTNQHSLSTTSTRNSELQSCSESVPSQEQRAREKIDSTLLVKTISKLLMMKLHRLIELISTTDHEISPIESKLVDDILIKNLSQRVLRPYHNLLYARAMNRVDSIY